MRLLLIVLLIALPAHAEVVRPTLDLTEVRLVVEWADSERDLENARAEHDGRRKRADGTLSLRDQSGFDLSGFSVLTVRDGKYTCTIHALKPAKVDDPKTMAIGHEVLHCLQGAYHR